MCGFRIFKYSARQKVLTFHFVSTRINLMFMWVDVSLCILTSELGIKLPFKDET